MINRNLRELKNTEEINSGTRAEKMAVEIDI
jgi:hypothetical protein